MGQGRCSTAACQQSCSPVEAELRRALAEIQTLAQQQLQALEALPGYAGQPPPAAGLAQAEAVNPGVTSRPGQTPPRLHDSKCGCRSTADCNCLAMDMTARLLYQSHEAHRRAA